jgi:hypothetical protein
MLGCDPSTEDIVVRYATTEKNRWWFNSGNRHQLSQGAPLQQAALADHPAHTLAMVICALT